MNDCIVTLVKLIHNALTPIESCILIFYVNQFNKNKNIAKRLLFYHSNLIKTEILHHTLLRNVKEQFKPVK